MMLSHLLLGTADSTEEEFPSLAHNMKPVTTFGSDIAPPAPSSIALHFSEGAQLTSFKSCLASQFA